MLYNQMLTNAGTGEHLYLPARAHGYSPSTTSREQVPVAADGSVNQDLLAAEQSPADLNSTQWRRRKQRFGYVVHQPNEYESAHEFHR